MTNEAFSLTTSDSCIIYGEQRQTKFKSSIYLTKNNPFPDFLECFLQTGTFIPKLFVVVTGETGGRKLWSVRLTPWDKKPQKSWVIHNVCASFTRGFASLVVLDRHEKVLAFFPVCSGHAALTMANTTSSLISPERQGYHIIHTALPFNSPAWQFIWNKHGSGQRGLLLCTLSKQ